VRGGFPAGDTTPYLERNLPSGLFHASASLGIAEAAFTRVAAPERIAGDARAEMLVAESAVDLAAARGVIARAATLVDDHYAVHPADDGNEDEITAVFSEGQAAKAFVGEAARRVVDRALALSGGAGYLNGSPLARAYAFLARVALGLRPQLA
jgi:alkylation response protein AidB-like acyl-CoA dehydrogenase